jgi:aspartyl protease family protein
VDPRQQEINEQKGIGGKMILAMWLMLLVLMAFIFNHILDQQHNPNQNIQTSSGTDGSQELALKRNRGGHYVTSGSINGHELVFMLDTGASDVSIPQDIARQIGLQRGRPMVYQTANGRITVYATRLDEIAIGDIRLRNIRATINPHYNSEDILLGMSFLKHLEFSQRGDTLTLRQYPDNS